MDQNSVKPLQDLLDSVRDIDGFPIGNDEDILALSDPPFHTACPNPYIKEFIDEYGNPYDPETDDYHREPFIGEVKEGKNDKIYMAHSYPTKVPPNAISKYIEHYSNEGDIILDSFCGTGMTGVAASRVNRRSLLFDLSPLASFIAYNYSTKIPHSEFIHEANRIIEDVKNECLWMLQTKHTSDSIDTHTREKIRTIDNEKVYGEIVYTVWSNVFICPYCKEKFVLWDAAVDREALKEMKEFKCLNCDAELKSKDCPRATKKIYDPVLNSEIEQVIQVPVMINYKLGTKRYEKIPDAEDIKNIDEIEKTGIPYWFPGYPMMGIGKMWGDSWRAGYHFGISHVHHFYAKRNLWILSKIHNQIMKIDDKRTRNFLLVWFTSGQSRLNMMNRYMPSHNRHVGPLSGTLYLSPYKAEISPFYFLFEDKYRRHKRLKNERILALW